MEMKKDEKYWGIQYLRAVAAIGVVVFHACSRMKINFLMGSSGVDLFFIISGFLMVSISKNDTDPGDFLMKRIKRIVPLYWLVTTIILLGAAFRFFPNQTTDLGYVIQSYLFIPAVSPVNGKIWPLLVPGWTLNYEMFFYLIFTLCLFIKNQSSRLMTLSGIMLSLVILGYVFRPQNPIVITYTGPLLIEFIAGAWLGRIWQNKRFMHQNLSLIALILAFGYLMVYGNYVPDHLRVIHYGIPCFVIFYAVISLEARGKMIRKWPTFKFLGDASYSIYLWHGLAISVALKLTSLLKFSTILTVYSCILAGLVAGSLSYLWIEKPLMRLLRSRANETHLDGPRLV